MSAYDRRHMDVESDLAPGETLPARRAMRADHRVRRVRRPRRFRPIIRRRVRRVTT